MHWAGGIARLGGLAVELGRAVPVLLHAGAVPVAVPQDVQGPGELLLRRLLQPVEGGGGVRLHPDAVETAHRQVGLGGGVALLRGLEVALRRPGGVGGGAAAVFVAQAQVALGGDVALLGGLLEQGKGPLLVLLHAGAGLIAPAQQVHRPEVPLLGGQGKPAGRLGRVPVGPVPLGVAHPHVVVGGGVASLRLLQQGLELLPRPLEAGHRLLNQVGIDKNDLLAVIGLMAIVGIDVHGVLPILCSMGILYAVNRLLSTGGRGRKSPAGRRPAGGSADPSGQGDLHPADGDGRQAVHVQQTALRAAHQVEIALLRDVQAAAAPSGGSWRGDERMNPWPSGYI